VNLGPRSYISTQDFYIVPGDRIHLTGSQVAATASGKQLFLPTEITYNGHTLRLRSATGAPLWEGQTGAAATPPLGYTPAEESATAPGRAGTTPSAATPPEPTPEELTGKFNPSAITSMDGTVTDVGKFRATATGQDMLWLRVRTTDGRMVLVNLGPRNYVSGQDFYIVRGDRIHLTGSEAATAAAGRRVLFLPTEITYNSHTLRLRSATGTPLWEGQTGTMGPSTSSEMQSKTRTSESEATGRPGTEPNEPNKP
jgi:transposase-like protein